MEYIYHSKAFDEYQQAVLHYRNISSVLAEEFVENVEYAISLIQEHPNAWMTISKNIRRCIVKKYPYSIFFSELNGIIYILAIPHQKRKPQYWKLRKL